MAIRLSSPTNPNNLFNQGVNKVRGLFSRIGGTPAPKSLSQGSSLNSGSLGSMGINPATPSITSRALSAIGSVPVFSPMTPGSSQLGGNLTDPRLSPTTTIGSAARGLYSAVVAPSTPGQQNLSFGGLTAGTVGQSPARVLTPTAEASTAVPPPASVSPTVSGNAPSQLPIPTPGTTVQSPAPGTSGGPIANPTPAQIDQSRTSAILGLVSQGIVDPSTLMNYLNYDQAGNAIGDFTTEEINQKLSNLGVPTVSGDQPKTIAEKYAERRKLTSAAAEANRQLIESQSATQVEEAKALGARELTAVEEARRGFATNTAYTRNVVETGEKRVRDLEKNRDELLLMNKAAEAERLDGLISDEQTLITSARKIDFDNRMELLKTTRSLTKGDAKNQIVTLGDRKVLMDLNTGEILADYGAGSGKAAGAGVTAKQKEQLGKISAVESSANLIESSIRELMDMGVSGTGRISGTLQKVAGAAGFSPKVTAFQDLRQSLISPLARTISGETGVLTDQDVARADGLLPRITDTEPEIELKLANLRTTIENAKGSILQSAGETSSGDSQLEDLFNQFIQQNG